MIDRIIGADGPADGPRTPGPCDLARALLASTRYAASAAKDLLARPRAHGARDELHEVACFILWAQDAGADLVARLDGSPEAGQWHETWRSTVPALAVERPDLVDDGEHDDETEAIRAGCRELGGALGRMAQAARILHRMLEANTTVEAVRTASQVADWLSMTHASASRAEWSIRDGSEPDNPPG